VKFPEGKTAAMMAKEYGVALPTIRWWARNNNVPYMGGDGIKMFFIFDKESEERFVNRKDYPGRIRDENIIRIAKQFGVSKQCVRNWASSQGLPKDENGYIIGEKEVELFCRRNKSGRPRKEKPEPEWKPPVLSAKGLSLGRPRKAQPAQVVDTKKEPAKTATGHPKGRTRKSR
jgi:hypothetical protein